MDTPGYDPVSATGMVAGGANIICFTTGRGSVFGSRPVPTVKLATNSELATRMTGDIDVDCSGVVEKGVPLEEMGRQVYDLLIEVASGVARRARNWAWAARRSCRGSSERCCERAERANHRHSALAKRRPSAASSATDIHRATEAVPARRRPDRAPPSQRRLIMREDSRRSATSRPGR